VFQAISAVTFAVQGLAASESAFRDWLGYRTVASGQVPAELPSIWNTPRTADRHFVVMEPESGEPVFLRLLEAPAVAGWAPLRTVGWNAAELHVQDVQGLAKRLSDSPFTIINGPRDLLKNGAAIAMQVRGPADELLYLTELNGKGMRRTYGEALSPVGRVFITVLGAAEHTASMQFYQRQCRRLYDRGEFPIRVLAKAYGLDPETARFKMASAVMRETFRIEIDDYPDAATPRPVSTGDIPPGMSMVTVRVDSIEQCGLELRAPAAVAPDLPPYGGGRIGLAVGPSGEWLELVEQPDL
jgi:hypothetical protein